MLFNKENQKVGKLLYSQFPTLTYKHTYTHIKGTEKIVGQACCQLQFIKWGHGAGAGAWQSKGVDEDIMPALN